MDYSRNVAHHNTQNILCGACMLLLMNQIKLNALLCFLQYLNQWVALVHLPDIVQPRIYFAEYQIAVKLYCTDFRRTLHYKKTVYHNSQKCVGMLGLIYDTKAVFFRHIVTG